MSAPAGATLRDANNVALTGSVVTTIVSVDPSQQASMALLPEGLSGGGLGKNAAGGNVVVASGNFSMLVNNVPAAAVANGTLRFNIPASVTTNPATGQPWAAGQTIPAYRYGYNTTLQNSTLSLWVPDGSFTVVAAGNGFAVETTRPVLSTGWWAAVVTTQATQTVTVTINRNGQDNNVLVALSQLGYAAQANLTRGKTVATFTGVPSTLSGRAATAFYGGQSVTSNVSGTAITLTLGAPPPNVTVNVTPKCPDPNKGIYFATLPSIFIYASETGQNNYSAIGDVSKVLTITRAGGGTTGKITKVSFTSSFFAVGKSYDVIGSYEGNTFGPETRSVTGATMDLDWNVAGDYCQ